jgi:hypothetical protein
MEKNILDEIYFFSYETVNWLHADIPFFLRAKIGNIVNNYWDIEIALIPIVPTSIMK